MHLLISIYGLTSGGAERVTANLANYWAEKGWRITLVTMIGDAPDFYELHPAIQRIALSHPSGSHTPLNKHLLLRCTAPISVLSYDIRK